MRRLKRAVAFAIGSIWLAGCATSAVDMAPERSDQPWNPATTATGEIIPGAKAPPGSSAPGYTLPSNAEVASVPPPPPGVDLRRVYTLPELIDIAQMNNPLTRTAWNDARKVALAAGIAESTYLPRISASAAGAYLTSEGNNSTTVAATPLAIGSNASPNNSARGTISAVVVAVAAVRFRRARSDRRRSEAGLGNLQHRVHRGPSTGHLRRQRRILRERRGSFPRRYRGRVIEKCAGCGGGRRRSIQEFDRDRHRGFASASGARRRRDWRSCRPPEERKMPISILFRRWVSRRSPSSGSRRFRGAAFRRAWRHRCSASYQRLWRGVRIS